MKLKDKFDEILPKVEQRQRDFKKEREIIYIINPRGLTS